MELFNEEGSLNGKEYLERYADMCRTSIEAAKIEPEVTTAAEELHAKLEEVILSTPEYTGVVAQLALMSVTLTIMNGADLMAKAEALEKEVLGDGNSLR